MSRLSCLIACLFIACGALAAEEPRAEFTAKSSDYEAAFGEASAAIKQIILDESFDVVGVADFTDLAGQPLQIGRLYAEEFATRLVGPRKKYRLLDPGTLLGLVEAAGGTSLWATPEKIRQFGAKSKVDLVVTGRIEIAAKEARFFIKAIATEDAGVVWAKTIAVPGISAAAAAAAAQAEVEALAAQTKLVAQPMNADATGDAVAELFTGSAAAATGEPAAASTTTPASTPTIGALVAASVPAVSASSAPVTAPPPITTPPLVSAPVASVPAAGVAAAAVAITATPAPRSVAPAPTTPSPKPATPPPAAASSAPVAAAVTAPVSTGAAAVTAVAATAAAGIAATSSAPPPAPKAVAAPAPPPEVLTFENAWLRARVKTVSKYEGSGWVTAVLDLTNLSDRLIKVDAAQDDPGKGVDELGNNWKIERVSVLKLASGAGTANTLLNPSSTITVVVVLATTAQPSGRRLSFGPNLYWFGSAAVGDSGRVALAFSNIRVN